MKREEIIRMARESGIEPLYTRPQDSIVRKGYAISGELKGYKGSMQDLERFAALVAVAERDAVIPLVFGSCSSDNEAQRIVNAIRARGQACE